MLLLYIMEDLNSKIIYKIISIGLYNLLVLFFSIVTSYTTNIDLRLSFDISTFLTKTLIIMWKYLFSLIGTKETQSVSTSAFSSELHAKAWAKRNRMKFHGIQYHG
jgi:hypothetical protein